MITKKPAYARRRSSKQALDDFPTPPWAVRALFKYVIPDDFARASRQVKKANNRLVVREPVCGRGHIVQTLREYDLAVVGSDIKDYGYGFKVDDYPHGSYCEPDCDFVITNPPYKESPVITSGAS